MQHVWTYTGIIFDLAITFAMGSKNYVAIGVDHAERAIVIPRTNT
jgi:hypothetical protein